MSDLLCCINILLSATEVTSILIDFGRRFSKLHKWPSVNILGAHIQLSPALLKKLPMKQPLLKKICQENGSFMKTIVL